jgi:ATP synthase I subunit
MENYTKIEESDADAQLGRVQIRRLIRGVLMTETIVLAVACLVSALVMRQSGAAFSVALGAVMSMLSFVVLAVVVYKSMTGQGRAVVLITALGTIKVLALGALLWWLISTGVADPIAFMIGFGTMVLALIIEGMKFKKS